MPKSVPINIHNTKIPNKSDAVEYQSSLFIGFLELHCFVCDSVLILLAAFMSSLGYFLLMVAVQILQCCGFDVFCGGSLFGVGRFFRRP